jgi:hypothetical protein
MSMSLQLTHRSSTVAASKADQVFLPVVENASKAQKLRTTLSVFERSKFFFNLPGTLLESIAAVGLSVPTIMISILTRTSRAATMP